MNRRGTQRPQFKGSPPTVVPAWAPTDIANCTLWLDASDSATITLDGSSNVSDWLDKSGSSNHATQATTTLRPSMDTVNGLDAVTFDAVDDVLTGTTLLASNAAFTLFGVVRKNAAGTDRVAYFITGTDKGFGLSVASNVGFFDLPGYLNGGVAWRADGSGAIANGTTVLQQLSRTPDATSSARYPGPITQSNTDVPAATPYGVYRIGWQGGAGTGRQNNTVCEILFYDRDLTAGEKTTIRAYLGTKWGVAV